MKQNNSSELLGHAFHKTHNQNESPDLTRPQNHIFLDFARFIIGSTNPPVEQMIHLGDEGGSSDEKESSSWRRWIIWIKIFRIHRSSGGSSLRLLFVCVCFSRFPNSSDCYTICCWVAFENEISRSKLRALGTKSRSVLKLTCGIQKCRKARVFKFLSVCQSEGFGL